MSKLNVVCTLEYRGAINAIQNTEKVYFKSGVWNSYQLVDTAYAIQRIKNCGYGADVYHDPIGGYYYVSCPCASDMW